MSRFNTSLIFFYLLGCVYSDPIHFSDCGSTYDLRSVDIQGCTDLPCPLLMKSYVNITVKMVAKSQAEKARQDIYFTTKGINTKTSSAPETCSSQRPCPIKVGDATFSSKLWVPDIAPFTSKLTWKIFDENSKQLLCFYTDVHLCYENDSDPKCY